MLIRASAECVCANNRLLNVNCYRIICCLEPRDNDIWSMRFCVGAPAMAHACVWLRVCMWWLRRAISIFLAPWMISFWVQTLYSATFIKSEGDREKSRQRKKERLNRRRIPSQGERQKKDRLKRRDIKTERESFRREYNPCTVCCGSCLQGGRIWTLNKSLTWAQISQLTQQSLP